jgi:hypothetical protein
VRQQDCSNTAVRFTYLKAVVSPTTTFIQGAAKALLRARKASRKRTFKSAHLTQGDAAPDFKVSEAQESPFSNTTRQLVQSFLFAATSHKYRISTRYDRCPKVFLSAIALAATSLFWL